MLNAIDISTLNRDELVKLLAEVFARLIGPAPLQRQIRESRQSNQRSVILGFAPGYTYELCAARRNARRSQQKIPAFNAGRSRGLHPKE